MREAAAEIRAAGKSGSRDGTTLAAGITVNATGAWAPELTPASRCASARATCVITDRYPGFVRHILLELGYLKSAHSITADSVAFNVQPRRTGQMLIGSSRQFGSEGRHVEHHMLRAHAAARAKSICPSSRS